MGKVIEYSILQSPSKTLKCMKNLSEHLVKMRLLSDGYEMFLKVRVYTSHKFPGDTAGILASPTRAKLCITGNAGTKIWRLGRAFLGNSYSV